MMSRNGDMMSLDETGEFNRNESNSSHSPRPYSKTEKDKHIDDMFPLMDGNASQYDAEINRLQLSNKQLKLDLQAEQENVLQFRKKINSAEKQKLETTSKSNSEIASLEMQIAKLRSQLERGEATRHGMEYELTKSQREVNSIKHSAKEKETLLLDGTDNLKKNIGDLSDEVKRLQKSLQSCKENADENEQNSKRIIEETGFKLSKTQADLDSAQTEKENLNELCQKHSNVILGLDGKLQQFESDKRSVLDSLRKATAELEYTREREERLKSDLEGALSRKKIFEENIEAERAAHLETKFNSEIVQLRVRDLDGAIDVEKSANVEANKAIERITRQNRELEQVYEEERTTRKELNMKIDKLEKEYMAVRRQLSSEVDDKKSIIGNLSKELESHQKNFNELKSELSKAKKRQIFLEEMYGGSIKELEFLLQTFHFDDKKLRIATRKEDLSAASAKGAKKQANPKVIVENFKQMLIQLKKRLDSQIEELSKSKKNSERLGKELDSSKEIIKAKDKTIEDTQKNYIKAAKDLNKARTNYTELESTISKLKTSLQTNTSNQDKDRVRIQELSGEIMKLVKRHRAEEEERIAFLHGLYQRLLAGHLAIRSKDKMFNQFSWSDMTEVVYEQVSALVDLLETSDEKLKRSNNSARDRDYAYSSLKQDHEEQISKLTNMAREREALWQRQKEELEQHYNELLSDLQNRTKKTQAIADQAWEKLRATGSVQQGLETEVVELRRELAESQVQASSLLSACALLSGALYPLYMKASSLSSECHILDDLFCTWETCKERAIYLSAVLSSGKDSEQDQPERDSRFQRKVSPILRFRVGVIAVLAANRLAFLGAGCVRCFVSYSSNVDSSGLQVSTGGLAARAEKVRAVNLSFHQEPQDESGFGPASEAEQGLSSWLKSTDLLEVVIGSMTELQDSLRVIKDSKSRTEVKLVVTAARSGFTKLIDRLSYFFPSSTLPIHSSMRERSSLLRKLERHLSSIVNNTPQHLKGSLISSQEVMSNLQSHVLDLTQRLHSAEKERRYLLSDFNDLKQQIGDENNSLPHTSEKSSSVKGTKYVAMEKFEKVCVELSSALRREQKAQVLLQEQSSQLTQLTSRLDVCVSEEMKMQEHLVHNGKSLTDLRQQLRHKNQSLRQIEKQIGHSEHDKESLSSNLKDAENALRTVARDKGVLAQYTKSVEGALEIAKKQFLILCEPAPLSEDVSLSRLLLNAELIPHDIGKAGPELIAVQNLVGGFVDAQHQAVKKIRSLEEEIMSHRDHIDTLKRELSNAVQREFNEKVENATDGAFSLLPDDGSSGKDIFLPLKEDSDVSFESLPSPSKPSSWGVPTHSSVKPSKKSAFHSVKSNTPVSPRKSPRP